jgi:glycine cleavage system H protein
MSAKDYEIADDCSYGRTDEWIRVDGANARIGISDYAQSELSDIVFIEMPEIGSQIRVGEPFGVVESVKAVSDLVAPLTGEIIQVNEALEENPELVNEQPYEGGWIVEIQVESLDDDHLLTPKEYRAYVEERAGE